MRSLRPFTTMVCIVAGVFCIASQAAAAQAPQQINAAEAHAMASRRAASLTRGTNASGWFGGWGDYSPEHTSSYMAAADFASMHAMGMQYVRFPLDPALLSSGGLLSPHKDAIWNRIDAALDQVQSAHLAIDFVVFPKDDYKQQLSTQHGVDQFVLLWQVLAKHFADRDPETFFFELMNESQMQDPYRWSGVQSAVVAAIRQVDTRHTILASGAHYDSLDDLLVTQPLNDPNTIYTFHFYEPYPFTHQGAPWGSFEWNYFKDIPYPATPAQIEERMKTVPGDAARYQLFLYGAAGWNRASIARRIDFVADWSKEHDVPVICNEFGAFRDTAPPASRANYLEDVRRGLEQHKIGWAMWDWRGNFGLVTHQGDTISPDAIDVQALGLKTP